MEIRALLDGMDRDDFRAEAAEFAAQHGLSTFGHLVDLIATTQDGQVSRQACRVFSLLSAGDETYLALTRHPHQKVRVHAASMFRGEQALKYAHELVPVLADDDYYVAREARWAFDSMGPDVLPLLQEARRTAKGAVRRGAWQGIAEVGGPDAFTEWDRRVLRRFIAAKVEEDLYSSEEMHLCGGWYAIRTDNQQAVLEVCGLSDPVPVTKILGGDAWNNDHHSSAKEDEHVRCARVYVTGAWDGWTLVFGEPFAHASRPVTEICAVLSAAFGEAHYYAMHCQGGGNEWCVAEGGEVIRYYDESNPDEQIGEPLDAEDGLKLPHDWSDENEDLDDCYATDVAEEMSANPKYFEGDVEGYGVLALTACGLKYGSPKGFLRITY
ncbi:HEAT repeat domain-containing protein [Lentzea sp. NPDC006480]|uniref:HEAT repeat domain-containing protein n=1 Tax=Lentzea sp. NPDC006480 TaxID=3157176 RepID=UPI0033A01F02